MSGPFANKQKAVAVEKPILPSAAQVAEKQSKAKAEGKPKKRPPVTISVTFSAEDHERVMKKLDGRPARSNLAGLILETMFGGKK